MSSSETPSVNGAPAAEQPGEESSLPPLSDREFKAFNRLAERMDYFV
jgi:hypothetical protein